MVTRNWSTPIRTAPGGCSTSKSTQSPTSRSSRRSWTPRPTAPHWPNDPCYRSRAATPTAERCIRRSGGGGHIGVPCTVRSTHRRSRRVGNRSSGPNQTTQAAASEEQRVTEKKNDQTSDEVTVETTSVFRADFLNELDAPAQAGTETSVSGVEGLPVGSALLVVKRGPNAGSRFLLDQPTTSAGRHPDSDIFLDDVTVSRRHAEFRLETDEFHVVDVGSLNGTYVNREPVDSAVLANGDEVQIGKFRLVFLTGPKVGDDGGPGS